MLLDYETLLERAFCSKTKFPVILEYINKAVRYPHISSSDIWRYLKLYYACSKDEGSAKMKEEWISLEQHLLKNFKYALNLAKVKILGHVSNRMHYSKLGEWGYDTAVVMTVVRALYENNQSAFSIYQKELFQVVDRGLINKYNQIHKKLEAEEYDLLDLLLLCKDTGLAPMFIDNPYELFLKIEEGLYITEAEEEFFPQEMQLSFSF